VSRQALFAVLGGSTLLVALLFAATTPLATRAAPSSAPAGGAVVAQATPVATPAAATTGRPLERRDWVSHIPLFCALTMLVILVDAAVIGKVAYDRARARRRPAPQV
jgi:hypothetical protein